MIIRIFAAREPAKPLNDAQMCGSFLFLWVYGNKNSVYKKCDCHSLSKHLFPLIIHWFIVRNNTQTIKA